MTAASSWRANHDPLYRGDGRTLSSPDPKADPSIVRHILYLDGPGRPTPYHSTTESREVAARFAEPNGRVFETKARRITANGAKHVSRVELLGLLRGTGKGDARWRSAFEVMQARKYVEEWREHLVGYAAFPDVAAAARAGAAILE
ncbi:MAG: hypothetical protein JW940_33855 [Polyangiaceae bacterium]|nr:hypothetical protein [Polyangiaceae bacterium]